MITKKNFVAVLLAFCISSIMLVALPTRSQTTSFYDPWADVSSDVPGEPDGVINMKDIAYEVALFNTHGTPINKTDLISSTVSYYQWSGGGFLSSSEAVLCSQDFILLTGGKIEVYGGAFYWSESNGNRYVSNLRIYLNDTLKSAQYTGVSGSAYYDLSVTHSEFLTSGNYTVQLRDIATEWPPWEFSVANVYRQVSSWTIVVTSFAK